MSTTPPIEHFYDLSRLSDAGAEVVVSARPEELPMLAQWLKVESVQTFEGIVTLTKLVAEARIALIGRGALLAASRTMDGPALRATLDWLIDEMLVSDEAERLMVGEVDRSAVSAELKRFEGRFSSEREYRQFLERAGLSEQEVSAALARGVRVRRYLESRLGRSAQVSDADLDLAVKERGLGPPSPKLREALRSTLVEERAKAQAQELVSELRARADIRILERFDEPGAAGQAG